MQNLKVKIPERFKPGLSDRFDAKNAVIEDGEHRINVKCGLCERYLEDNCNRCPFKKFKGANYGCMIWVSEVLNETETSWVFHVGIGSVSWEYRNNQKARRQIRLLRRRAKKLIIWV